jgi:hypothetical protein
MSNRRSLKPKETGLSSNAVPVLRFSSFAFLITGLIALPVPAFAQSEAQQSPPEEAQENTAETAAPVRARRQFSGVDLAITVPKDPSDELLQQDCEDEADAGRIAGEIVVCRQIGEASDGSFNKEEWERKYAEKTAYKNAPRTPDTFGIPNHGPSIGFGSVPPPALFIDIEALPQAPEGSDADRIARGLPPLGQDEGLSPEEIAKRRRELGLEAPEIPKN